MIAAFELANSALAAAKEGIDNPGTMSEAEILELIATARRLIDRTTETARLEAVQAHGKAALEELDQLERVRRLLAYGLALGRTTKESMKLHNLLATRPAISKTGGIHGAASAFAWLAANRREISELLATINPSDK
jgi:phosphoribosylanthranilate isomerase